MEQNKLTEIGKWLNSKGLDIDLNDNFWMEEYLFKEYKVKDIAELINDYANEHKTINN